MLAVKEPLQKEFRRFGGIITGYAEEITGDKNYLEINFLLKEGGDKICNYFPRYTNENFYFRLAYGPNGSLAIEKLRNVNPDTRSLEIRGEVLGIPNLIKPSLTVILGGIGPLNEREVFGFYKAYEGLVEKLTASYRYILYSY